MLDFLRRQKAERRPGQADSVIEADLRGGTFLGPVAVGEHIVQIHADHGAIVNYVEPERRPDPHLRRPPPRRVPRDFGPLLGRDDVLAAARTCLEAGEPVEVHGPEGIGKTALLRHLAHRLDPANERALVYAGCRRLPGSDVLQLLFESVYECDQAMVATAAELAELLPEPRALFLLDDVGLDRSDVERVIGLASASSFLLATDERRLWGEGRSIELVGLDGPDALALFERESGITLEGEDRARAVALCAEIGHPLRVLQAAALAARGEAALAALSAAASHEPAGFGAALVGSLSERELLVASPLAALPGASVDAERVAEVTGAPEAPELLAGLEELGVARANSPSYRLTEAPARALGAELRAEHADARWLERLLSELTAWARRQSDPAAIAGAAGSVLAALDAAGAAGLRAEALALARAADWGLVAAGRWGAWREALGHALSAATGIEDRASEAWALHQLGSRALSLGEAADAKDALARALELRERLGDADGAAVTRHNLGLLGNVPPGPGPHDHDGPPGWLLPVLAIVAMVAVVVGVVALTGGDDKPAPDDGATLETVEDGTEGGEGEEPAGITPAILDPEAVVFEGVPVGEQRTQAVTATNPGPEPISLGDVTFDPEGGPLSITDECSRQELAPGEGCTITVAFLPPDEITYQGTLSFSDTGAGEPAVVPVTATGLAPAP